MIEMRKKRKRMNKTRIADTSLHQEFTRMTVYHCDALLCNLWKPQTMSQQFAYTPPSLFHRQYLGDDDEGVFCPKSWCKKKAVVNARRRLWYRALAPHFNERERITFSRWQEALLLVKVQNPFGFLQTITWAYDIWWVLPSKSTKVRSMLSPVPPTLMVSKS